MRKVRWMIVLPLLLLASLACGLVSGIQQIQQAATELPGMLTSAPTLMGPLETAAAEFTPPADGTPGAQNLSLETAKMMLEMTQQFKFRDDTIDGQPAVVAGLSDSGISSFPAMKDGFSATYIGDPQNLSQIKVTAPRTDSQDSVDQGITLMSLALSGALPVEVKVDFVSWLTENYAGVAVSGKLDKTVGNFQFTLERSDTSETLTVVPISK